MEGRHAAIAQAQMKLGWSSAPPRFEVREQLVLQKGEEAVSDAGAAAIELVAEGDIAAAWG